MPFLVGTINRLIKALENKAPCLETSLKETKVDKIPMALH
jgi:hypothetical protein